MDVLVTIAAEDSADQLRDLHAWLSEEPQLRGRIRVLEHSASPGALGPVTDGLQVAVGAAGTAMASVLIAWLGNRRGEVSITLSRSQTEIRVEVTAKGVKALDLAATRALTTEIAEILSKTETPHGSE